MTGKQPVMLDSAVPKRHKIIYSYAKDCRSHAAPVLELQMGSAGSSVHLKRHQNTAPAQLQSVTHTEHEVMTPHT